MDIARAAEELNAVAYGYISSWALLTACRRRLFDRLPAAAADLSDEYPDADLFDTWMWTLAEQSLVTRDDGTWQPTEEAAALLVGDGSYADYLGGQILEQMTPRLMTSGGVNRLDEALTTPQSRSGYEGWFADAAEAERYQASQYAGSLLPGRTIARHVEPDGRVLDLGGGWGAIAQAIAARHDVDVDVVDLEPVVDAAPPAGERVRFEAGSALDPATWPERDYDGAVLSYLFSSVPGDAHQPVLDALGDRGLRWVAVHDFMVGSGSLAAGWSLQHAVFVPGHVSRPAAEVAGMLGRAGFGETTEQPVVAEMTTMVVGRSG